MTVFIAFHNMILSILCTVDEQIHMDTENVWGDMLSFIDVRDEHPDMDVREQWVHTSDLPHLAVLDHGN